MFGHVLDEVFAQLGVPYVFKQFLQRAHHYFSVVSFDLFVKEFLHVVVLNSIKSELFGFSFLFFILDSSKFAS